jgi:hypothetical protein
MVAEGSQTALAFIPKPTDGRNAVSAPVAPGCADATNFPIGFLLRTRAPIRRDDLDRSRDHQKEDWHNAAHNTSFSLRDGWYDDGRGRGGPRMMPVLNRLYSMVTKSIVMEHLPHLRALVSKSGAAAVQHGFPPAVCRRRRRARSRSHPVPRTGRGSKVRSTS